MVVGIELAVETVVVVVYVRLNGNDANGGDGVVATVDIFLINNCYNIIAEPSESSQ